MSVAAAVLLTVTALWEPLFNAHRPSLGGCRAGTNLWALRTYL